MIHRPLAVPALSPDRCQVLGAQSAARAARFAPP